MCLGRRLLPPVRLEIVCFSLDSSLAEVGISQMVWEQANEQKKDFSCYLSRRFTAIKRGSNHRHPHLLARGCIVSSVVHRYQVHLALSPVSRLWRQTIEYPDCSSCSPGYPGTCCVDLEIHLPLPRECWTKGTMPEDKIVLKRTLCLLPCPKERDVECPSSVFTHIL